MPLILKPETVRVPLSCPGEWVEIKSRLSKGDATKISAASFKLRAAIRDNAESYDVGLDYEASVFAGLEVGVVAWSFPEPLTPENLRGLSEEDYEIISRRANELWERRSDDESKNSPGGGPTTSSAEELHQPSSSG